MALLRALCKWFGHSWRKHPQEWGRRDCGRCDVSQVAFYSKERGLFRDDVNNDES